MLTMPLLFTSQADCRNVSSCPNGKNPFLIDSMDTSSPNFDIYFTEYFLLDQVSNIANFLLIEQNELNW